MEEAALQAASSIYIYLSRVDIPTPNASFNFLERLPLKSKDSAPSY